MVKKTITELIKEVFYSSNTSILHLKEIIEQVQKVNPEIKSPSIRAALEIHSSDSHAYNGKEDIFHCVYGTDARKGMWALRQSSDSLLKKLDNQIVLIETAKNTSAICEVEMRLVQGEFRTQLIKKYQGCCPLTQINKLNFLIASHIKPWSESNDKERLDVNNGILLSTHLDKLFDLGEISFDDDGNLLCKTIETRDLIKKNFYLKEHNIKVGDEKTNGLSVSMKQYLLHHRKKFHFDDNSILFV